MSTARKASAVFGVAIWGRYTLRSICNRPVLEEECHKTYNVVKIIISRYLCKHPKLSDLDKFEGWCAGGAKAA